MYHEVTQIEFPEYPGPMAVNMMPFIFGDPGSIPDDLKPYLPIIDRCQGLVRGRVGYLTVHTGAVEVGKTLRRPGIHTEGGKIHAFGGGTWGGGTSTGWNSSFGGGGKFGGGTPPVHPSSFGGGSEFGGGVPAIPEPEVSEPPKKTKRHRKSGKTKEPVVLTHEHLGVYMGSTDGACRAWNEITYDVDDLGALLVPPKGPGERMKGSFLYWMDDRTPHEALPSDHGGVRQFIRVISHDVGTWWSQHNTANPLGIQPEARIVHTSKF